jgi:hypothetical protein
VFRYGGTADQYYHWRLEPTENRGAMMSVIFQVD